MEQKEKPHNSHNNFDYANFENELIKPVPKSKPSNLLKENIQEFSESFKNERERSPTYKSASNRIAKNAGVSSSSRISPPRNSGHEKFDSSSTSKLIFNPSRNRQSVHEDKTLSIKENINDENRISPKAGQGPSKHPERILVSCDFGILTDC